MQEADVPAQLDGPAEPEPLVVSAPPVVVEAAPPAEAEMLPTEASASAEAEVLPPTEATAPPEAEALVIEPKAPVAEPEPEQDVADPAVPQSAEAPFPMVETSLAVSEPMMWDADPPAVEALPLAASATPQPAVAEPPFLEMPAAAEPSTLSPAAGIPETDSLDMAADSMWESGETEPPQPATLRAVEELVPLEADAPVVEPEIPQAVAADPPVVEMSLIAPESPAMQTLEAAVAATPPMAEADPPPAEATPLPPLDAALPVAVVTDVPEADAGPQLVVTELPVIMAQPTVMDVASPVSELPKTEAETQHVVAELLVDGVLPATEEAELPESTEADLPADGSLALLEEAAPPEAETSLEPSATPQAAADHASVAETPKPVDDTPMGENRAMAAADSSRMSDLPLADSSLVETEIAVAAAPAAVAGAPSLLAEAGLSVGASSALAHSDDMSRPITAGRPAVEDEPPSLAPPPRPVEPHQPTHPTARVRRVRPVRPHRVRRSVLLFIEVLLMVLITFTGTSIALDARAQLAQAQSLAHDGLRHLTHLQSLMAGQDKLAIAMNPATLAQAQSDLVAAEGDFARLRAQLVSPRGSVALAARVPLVRDPLAAAANLASAADEACQGGLLALSGIQLALSILHGGIFSDGSSASGAPAFTQAKVDQLTALFDGALQHFDTAVAYAGQANLAELPASLLSAHQRQQLATVLADWPSWRPLLLQARALLGGLPAILGVTSPVAYLIELMDRTELRPGGGFIGNYAVMTVANGKIQPFAISDTYLLDYPYLDRQHWYSPAPAAFSWWPWASYYGLRDSNFSADFPTTAQLGMQALVREGGPSTQGVIAITPPAIARILQVVGSIPMPLYGQTVTAQNLEGLIHYYQEAIGHDPLTGLPRSDLLSSSRKRFTALLARALLTKLHALTPTQLVAIGKQLLTSLRLKELQVYVTASPIEGLLGQYGLSGSVSTGPGDGVTIVDANATANKANQFVTVTYRDAVTLDASGTATHQLTITYAFNATNVVQLYGPDRYLTYLRVYVPLSAQLLHLDGLSNLLHHDQINQSDLAWRQMWGGYVLVSDHVSRVLHITWRVAGNVSLNGAAPGFYHLEYQHQAGANQLLDLTITAPGQTVPVVQYSGALDADRVFTVSVRP